MKTMIVGALSIVTVLMVSSAFAADHGNVAIGYDGYDGGLSLRIFPGSGLGFEGIVGMSFEGKNKDLGHDDADFDFYLGANLIIPFKMAEKANLNSFIGGALEMADSHVKDFGTTSFYINAGLAPEIFLLDNLSVETKCGLRISIIGESFKDAKDNRFRIQTYGQGVNIIGGAAFHWYF